MICTKALRDLGGDQTKNDDDQMDQEDDHIEGKEDKSSALEKVLLEYQFSEDDDDGEVDGGLLMTHHRP